MNVLKTVGKEIVTGTLSGATLMLTDDDYPHVKITPDGEWATILGQKVAIVPLPEYEEQQAILAKIDEFLKLQDTPRTMHAGNVEYFEGRAWVLDKIKQIVRKDSE